MNSNRGYAIILALLFSLNFLIPAAQAQQMSSIDRGRVLSMLEQVSKDVEKHYYDPKFHGVDWNAIVRQTRQKIKSETSLNMAMAHVAQALVYLKDSHTFFLPPSRPYVHDMGFQLEMIGSRCYIQRVRPGSDAAAKGMKPGDELITLENFIPTRDNLWLLNYRFNLLRPAPAETLYLRDPHGQELHPTVDAKFRQLSRLQDVTGMGIWDLIRDEQNQEHRERARWAEVGDNVGILKLPVFYADASEVDSMIGRARKVPALILDLRGNPGGSVETLKYILGGLFDKDVKIADRAGRKESKPEIAKSRKHEAFGGKLIVLVDSESASAAELLARVVQLEKRGMVLGDQSSGSVMEAKHFSYSVGLDTKVFFGASITEADLIMSDGKSLEHRGVTPDLVVLPTADDLAVGRDPVLSRAAAMLGVRLTPEDAGKMFPYEWPEE